jgi:hypothetical protein
MSQRGPSARAAPNGRPTGSPLHCLPAARRTVCANDARFRLPSGRVRCTRGTPVPGSGDSIAVDRPAPVAHDGPTQCDAAALRAPHLRGDPPGRPKLRTGTVCVVPAGCRRRGGSCAPRAFPCGVGARRCRAARGGSLIRHAAGAPHRTVASEATLDFAPRMRQARAGLLADRGRNFTKKGVREGRWSRICALG